MRALPVALLLAASLMAGCTGGDDEPPSGGGTGNPPTNPPTTGGGTPTPEPEPVTEFNLMTQFTFDGCSGVRFEGNVPMEDAQALLPEGYQALEDADPAALPLEQAALGIVHAQLYNCTSFTAGSFAFENVYFGMSSIPVDRPDDGVDAQSHEYIIEMIAGEDVLAAVWPAAGYPMFNGSVVVVDTPLIRSLGVAGYSIDSSKAIPTPATVTGTFAWYHEREDGDRLLWTGTQDLPGGSGGAGNLAVSEDSGLASLFIVAGTTNLAGEGAAIDGASFSGMDLIQELAAGRE